MDRSFVSLTPHLDRNLTYVALSRHRFAIMVFQIGADAFDTARGRPCLALKTKRTAEKCKG